MHVCKVYPSPTAERVSGVAHVCNLNEVYTAQAGKSYFVASVGAVGTCVDFDPEFDQPVRIEFDPTHPDVLAGRLLCSARYSLSDLREVEGETP